MATVQDMAAKLSAMIDERLGIAGAAGLEVQMKRAGRRLPASVRRDAAMIVDALSKAGSPKLMKQVDLPRLEAAERRVLAHLRTIDRADRRKGVILGLLGSLSFNLIALVTLLIAVLVWRGYI